ncbi:MAG TPA: dUTP diphosphatase [Micromonosporaceae bacterium]|jgi:dUTP pyrophosphatase
MDAALPVPIGILRLDEDLPMPGYAHPGDAGADLYAAAPTEIPPGHRAVVPTGVALEIPDGYVGLVHPRSGLAAKVGVTVLNAPGTIDSGYRGEVMVILINHDPDSVAHIARGDRIAQLVIQRVERAEFRRVEVLGETVRGAGRHGSTGGHAALLG